VQKRPLNLIQSNIGLLRVFEPIEYRDGTNWVDRNDCFINELVGLNQPPFVWPLAKNRGSVGAGATN
jgi:hypothetical protein